MAEIFPANNIEIIKQFRQTSALSLLESKLKAIELYAAFLVRFPEKKQGKVAELEAWVKEWVKPYGRFTCPQIKEIAKRMRLTRDRPMCPHCLESFKDEVFIEHRARCTGNYGRNNYSEPKS